MCLSTVGGCSVLLFGVLLGGGGGTTVDTEAEGRGSDTLYLKTTKSVGQRSQNNNVGLLCRHANKQFVFCDYELLRLR